MSSITKSLSEVHVPLLEAAGQHEIAIITSAWNSKFTHAMREACKEVLLKSGIRPNNLHLYDVAGSYELIAASDLVYANQSSLSVVIAIGCIIQGETRHFNFISDAVANGLVGVGIKYGKPVIFGVLTTDTNQQAEDRAGGQHGNKGIEAAATALQMLALQEKLEKQKK
ncbi:MAG: 6,7-dimethyl-8-ribityllumazine synthase [Bacteroidota bacterium]|jgi:6,7-dimethyl-8-ribityllumazine synthase